MSTLAEMRAALAAQADRAQKNQTATGDRALYPFYNMAENQTAIVRFLPNPSPMAQFFWQERGMFKFPFAGVKDQNESKPVEVQVPCMEMYRDANGNTENDPVLSEVRTWFKNDNLKAMGRKYWKKKSYLFQGFVRQDPLNEEDSPENPIRRFLIGPQIMPIILAVFDDPEITELVTDYERGLDFRINKMPGADGPNYSTSSFARRESALSEAELAAIDQYGLFNLVDFLPKRPTDTEQRIIYEMFEASVNGELYDAERWGAYYRPWGLKMTGASESANDGGNHYQPSRVSVPVTAPVSAPVAQSAPVLEAEVEQVQVEAPSAPAADTGKTDTSALLEMIRKRQAQK